MKYKELHFNHICCVYDKPKKKACVCLCANQTSHFINQYSNSFVNALANLYGVNVKQQHELFKRYLCIKRGLPVVFKLDTYILIPFGNKRKAIVWINLYKIKKVSYVFKCYTCVETDIGKVYLYMSYRSVTKQINRAKEIIKLLDKI